MVEFSNLTNQTPNRVFNTVYQNLTGRPIIVMASGSLDVPVAGTGTNVVAYVGPTNILTTDNIVAQEKTLDSQFIGGLMYTITFIVPPNFYYKIQSYVDGSCTLNLDRWLEVL